MNRVLAGDHFAGTHAYLLWVRHPLVALLAVGIVAGLCGCFAAREGFIVLTVVVGLMGVGLAWPWLSLRGVCATLEFPDNRGTEGTPVQATLRLVNRWPLPVWGLAVRGGFPPAVEAADAGEWSVALDWVDAWSETRFEWTFVPRLRGEYPMAAPQLITAFPFGIHEARRGIDVSERVLVWPRTLDVTGSLELPGSPALDGTAQGERAGQGGELLGVRAYRRGDALRRIHWAQSARHDRLIVCEQHGFTKPLVQFLIDVGSPALGAGPNSAREWVVRCGASVVERLIEARVLVEPRFPGAPRAVATGWLHQRAVFDALARLAPAGCEPLAEALARWGRPAPGGGEQWVVTSQAVWETLPLAERNVRGRSFVLVRDAALPVVTRLGLVDFGVGWSSLVVVPRERGRMLWQREGAFHDAHAN